MDKLIQSRNRFNLHYHKADITTIPRDHRLPLLPNEEVHDWLNLRKLMSIEASFPKSRAPRDIIRDTRPSMDIRDIVGEKDPLLLQLYNDWQGLS